MAEGDVRIPVDCMVTLDSFLDFRNSRRGRRAKAHLFLRVLPIWAAAVQAGPLPITRVSYYQPSANVLFCTMSLGRSHALCQRPAHSLEAFIIVEQHCSSMQRSL